MMNIGIVDVDGHHFPNFALMRASAYHKARGDQVEWATPFNPVSYTHLDVYKRQI